MFQQVVGRWSQYALTPKRAGESFFERLNQCIRVLPPLNIGWSLKRPPVTSMHNVDGSSKPVLINQIIADWVMVARFIFLLLYMKPVPFYWHLPTTTVLPLKSSLCISRAGSRYLW